MFEYGYVKCVNSEITKTRETTSQRFKWNLAHSDLSQMQHRTMYEPEYKLDLSICGKLSYPQ